MKAITIKQPWASFIVHGIKDIENRTWPCPKTYIGQRVLIHAGADKRLMNIPPTDFMTEWQIEQIFTDKIKFPVMERNIFSVIIGSVEIVDCVVNHPSIWAEKTENYPIGINPKLHENITGKKVIYNWVLANPVLFEKPIPAKGRLSFWEYDGLLPFDAILEANKDVLKRIKKKGD